MRQWANHPKLIVVKGTFLDAVEKLLNTAPPPKAAKDEAVFAKARRSLKRARTRTAEVWTDLTVEKMMKESKARKKR